MKRKIHCKTYALCEPNEYDTKKKNELKIEVKKAEGVKCPRCWKILEDKCDRCEKEIKKS